MSSLQAVIFGAIGSIAETSDLQRQSFNQAFADGGLDWQWDVPTYVRLLTINGGRERIRTYAAGLNEPAFLPEEQVAQLHAAKTTIYATMIDAGMLAPRAGVVELIAACQIAAIPVALCTSTSLDNVETIQRGLAGKLDFGAFATVTTIDQAGRPKPAPDAYLHCLEQLGCAAADVIAIEDTPVSIASAVAGGVKVVATPGALTANQDFSAATLVVNDLVGVTPERLAALL